MRVLLIRHAQASVNGPDYDQLSTLGYEQADLLGQHLRSEPWHPSLVCVGPRLRHRQTWERVIHQGNSWPEASHHDALDELPAEEVLPMALPLLLQSDAEIAAVAQKMMTDAASTGVDFRDILKLLDAGLALWMAGEVERDTLESWAGFKRRVHETLDGLTQLAQPNTPAVAFTSAGFIATALGMIEGKTPSEIRAQILKVPNASITTLEREPSTRRWHVLNAAVDGFLPEPIRTQI